MKKTNLETADFETLKNYVLELHGRIMDKDYINPIAECLANRKDLTLFQKCTIIDLIKEQSEISFARHPALAAPKGMPLFIKGVVGYRVGMDEAKSGKISNPIPAWCEEQKQMLVAMERPTAQPLNDEQPADSVPGVPDEQRKTPQAIDDRILKLLPDLYDILVEEKVIAVSLSKSDFVRNITNGEVPKMRKDDPKTWVLRKVKFHEFVFQVKPYFNKTWHETVCRSAGLTRKQMDKRNTDKTVELGIKIERFLQKNGMK